MNINKLVRMANQIAENFDTGNQAPAIAGVLDHITRFWTLDMKKQITAHLSEGSTGLNEIAEAAIRELAKDDRYAA